MLLTSWLSCAELETKSYEVLEIFAGVAEIARTARRCDKKAAAVDLTYGTGLFRRGSMDLTTGAGFVSSCCNLYTLANATLCFDQCVIH